MVDPLIYNRLFQRDKDGESILEELATLFYDRPSYTKGDTHETAYKEGQRSVVKYLLHKSGTVPEGNDDSP